MIQNIKRYVPIIPFLTILSLFQCIAYGFDINFLKLYAIMPDGGITHSTGIVSTYVSDR
ncbi:hypothetical protein BACERE00191_01382 [Bacillus pacificus]|uniref:Uncharacterized protein n=1 Tax=Bacillus pacificus TaxID=2026187 RepID=A0A1Y5Z5B7_9BACI|nr:hypothetical protein BACERE00191_01382 [Bacillus pacificus]